VTQPVHDPSCIFCKIVQGQVPSARFLETDEAVAILDVHPILPGHALILPKAHHGQLDDLPDPIAAHIGTLLPRLCRAIRAATGADGINVIINNGRAAGQTIDHCHWHVVPRFHNDPVRWPWPQGQYAGDELERMRLRIEGAL
jgi:histidine triad (HIT) family protein